MEKNGAWVLGMVNELKRQIEEEPDEGIRMGERRETVVILKILEFGEAKR